MTPRGCVLRMPGCGPWWRRRTRRTRCCGRSWMPSGSCGGGWSCGWRSWNGACRWTALTRGRPARRSGSGRRTARRARQQSERERRRDRKRGGQPGHQGKGLARDPDPDEMKEAEPPAQCRSCKARPGRRGGRGLAVGAGHRRGGDPEGDRVGAAGPGVPVLRDGHVRGAAAWRAPGLGVLRGGAERRRGGADRVRERAARACRAGHGHAAGGCRSRRAGWTRPAPGWRRSWARPGSTLRCSRRWPARTRWPRTRPR